MKKYRERESSERRDREKGRMKEEETGHGDMTGVVAGGRRPWRGCGSGRRSSSCFRKEARKGRGCWGLEAKQRIEQLKEAAALEAAGTWRRRTSARQRRQAWHRALLKQGNERATRCSGEEKEGAMVYCCSCVKSTGKGREFSNGRERDGDGEARDGEAWPGRGRRRARWNGRGGEHEGARGSRGLCLREAGSEAAVDWLDLKTRKEGGCGWLDVEFEEDFLRGWRRRVRDWMDGIALLNLGLVNIYLMGIRLEAIWALRFKSDDREK